MIAQLKEFIRSLLEQIGFASTTLNNIVLFVTVLGFAVSGLLFLYRMLKKAMLLRNQRLLNRDLAYSNFSAEDVDRATRYYIPTYFQNVSPSEDHEPGRRYIAAAKSKLVPLFMKKVFVNNPGHKFYIIMADTGMGKTTFMINLYLAYKNKMTFFFSKPKSQIRLYPLGWKDALKKIEAIADKEQVILLLDAFDEDVDAIKDYKNRLNEILAAASSFRQVIITCRTQFFPSQAEEPHETGYFSYGSVNQAHKFQKLYISPFSDRDVEKYINRRYGWFEFANKKAAMTIARKSPDLVIRPMLLYFIDDLVSTQGFNYTFEIYEVLIEKWIFREYNKPSNRAKFESYEPYKRILYAFSHALAIDLYKKREERGGYYAPELKKMEFVDFISGVKKVMNINTSGAQGITIKVSDVEIQLFHDEEKTCKSLLNRDIEGKYKFSHRSIMEYFLAIELLTNYNFYQSFDFSGMSAAEKFLKEMMIVELRKKRGDFSLRNKPDPLATISHEKIEEVRSLRILELGIFNPLLLAQFKQLKYLAVAGCAGLQFIYPFYATILLRHTRVGDWRIKRYLTLSKYPNLEGKIKLLEELPVNSMINALRCYPQMNPWLNRLQILNKANDPIAMMHVEALDLEFLIDQLPDALVVQYHKFGMLVARASRVSVPEWQSEDANNEFIMQRSFFFERLKPCIAFYESMRILQERLPNCKIIF
jgi:hypothetical protein